MHLFYFQKYYNQHTVEVSSICLWTWYDFRFLFDNDHALK